MDLSLEEAAARFRLANAELLVAGAGSFSVGLAELAEGEALDELVERADAAMYQARRSDRG